MSLVAAGLFLSARIVPFPDRLFIAASTIGFVLLVSLLFLLNVKQNAEIAWVGGIQAPPEEHAMLVYQNQQDELRFMKSLQWNFVYYFLTSIGALFGLSELLKSTTEGAPPQLLALIFLAGFVLFDFGVYFLCEIQYKLVATRVQITKSTFYRMNYRNGEKFDFVKYNKDCKDDARFWRDPRLTVVFLMTALIFLLTLAGSTWNNFAQFTRRLLSVIA